MRTFFAVLKNNYLRTVPRVIPILVMTAITLATMIFGIYMTDVQQVKGRVVFIAPSDTKVVPIALDNFKITIMSERPPHSDLVKQKYDAYITVSDNGSYQIETLHNREYKNMLSTLLKDPDKNGNAGKTERGVGVNIIGFMMMFLLMLSFSNLFAFADDKEQGQLRRIAAAPASFGWYLTAHCFYCLSMLLPEFLLLVILKLSGWNIGFSLLQYAGLMTVLSFLGISFAMLLNILIKKPDNANMLGNSITVLTSVLAGSFYSFSKNNAGLDKIIMLLPQKELMDYVQYLQDNSAGKHLGSILYVIVFSLVSFVFSCSVLRKMYIKKV